MRYLIRFLGVCVLVLIPFLACMDFGGGETEGCEPYNFDWNGDPCSGVVCPPDDNECTREYCSGGSCRSEPVTNGRSCTYDGLSGVCVEGVCGENLCEGVYCNDEPCSTGNCDYVDGLCNYTPRLPDGTPCVYDGMDGVCVNGLCGENLCEDVECDDGDACTDDRCEYVDGTCDFAPVVCDDDSDCTEDTCNPTIGCEHAAAANGTPCRGGEWTCQDGSCAGYTQDFESLDQLSPTALSDDGWIVFGKVFAPDGTTYLYGYGSFPAPNNTGGFSGIALEQGDPDQGEQQLVIISDYLGLDAQIAGNRVEAQTYRERTITAEDVGKTVTLSFDAKRGDINDPGAQGCIDTTNPPCDSTADAYLMTTDPNAGDRITNLVEEDTTAIPGVWARYSISLEIDPDLVDQLLRVGFSATASNFEPSGVFYDNVLVVLEAP